MIYTEPFVLTGGPGNSTTLLSIDGKGRPLGQFDRSGKTVPMSLIYFAITLLVRGPSILR